MMQSISTTPQNSLLPLHIQSPPPVSASAIPDLFLIPVVLPTSRMPYLGWNHTVLKVWLLLLCNMLKFIYIVAYIRSFFIIIIAEEYFIVWMFHNWLILSPVDGHLNCFQFLVIMNAVQLPQIFAYRFLCRHKHSFFLGG